MPGRIFQMAAETNHIGSSKRLADKTLIAKTEGGVKNKEHTPVTTVVTGTGLLTPVSGILAKIFSKLQ